MEYLLDGRLKLRKLFCDGRNRTASLTEKLKPYTRIGYSNKVVEIYVTNDKNSEKVVDRECSGTHKVHP